MIIFRYFLARYRNFLPKVHQVPRNLPQAFCIGDVRRYDSIKPKKAIKYKRCKIIIKLQSDPLTMNSVSLKTRVI